MDTLTVLLEAFGARTRCPVDTRCTPTGAGEDDKAGGEQDKVSATPPRETISLHRHHRSHLARSPGGGGGGVTRGCLSTPNAVTYSILVLWQPLGGGVTDFTRR